MEESVSDAKITILSNGPCKVDGNVPLFDGEGNAIETREGKSYYLCRCGESANKPFCDGTHKTIGFDGTLATQG